MAEITLKIKLEDAATFNLGDCIILRSNVTNVTGIVVGLNALPVRM